MRRTRLVWWLFAVCLTVLLGAMAWVTHEAVSLERQRRDYQQLAEGEERIRLALWRMDAALMLLVAQEGSRPYAQYLGPPGAGQFVVELTGRGATSWRDAAASPWVRAHFRIDAGGRVASVIVPPGEHGATGEAALDALLSARGATDVLRASLPAASAAQDAGPPAGQEVLAAAGPNNVAVQNTLEYRARAVVNTQSQQFSQQFSQVGPAAQAPALREGPARAMWIGQELIVARRVRGGAGPNGPQDEIVGCLLDWSKLHEWLRGLVADLLPQARLEALPAEASPEAARNLVSLPLRLMPGDVPAEGGGGSRRLAPWLGLAWGGVLLAAGAVALLLRGELALSERRANFASSVTHELRTPLTSLRMYAEMLGEGAARGDEALRARCVKMIRSETHRLCRLVENVLTYSRVEAGRRIPRRESLTVAELVERVAPALTEQALAAGMELVLESRAHEAVLRTDVDAVGQILSNLVDNARKYAAEAVDRRIHLEIELSARHVVFTVRDHGAGVPRADRRRIFRPFERARRDSSVTRGGVGLGLSISRAIARRLRGRLEVGKSAEAGAAFVLSLPRS